MFYPSSNTVRSRGAGSIAAFPARARSSLHVANARLGVAVSALCAERARITRRGMILFSHSMSSRASKGQSALRTSRSSRSSPGGKPSEAGAGPNGDTHPGAVQPRSPPARRARTAIIPRRSVPHLWERRDVFLDQAAQRRFRLLRNPNDLFHVRRLQVVRGTQVRHDRCREHVHPGVHRDNDFRHR
jgi:hypothetical protein